MQAEPLSSALRNGFRKSSAHAKSEGDALPIHSLHEDEIQDAEYQVLWNITMDQGEYNHPSAYDKVVVLLLCWAPSSNDLKTTEEVNALRLVLEERFRYHTSTQYLDNDNKQRLQVQLNSKVAAFVGANDGPNTLLIVYYAGHGKPGKLPGDLEMFGKTTPNEEKKRIDTIVWNKAEKILEDAEADVLELFDCCHAGQLAVRGQRRLFEFLAACGPTASTKPPGNDSFTSALIYALEKLVEERPDGRFTTIDLLQVIQGEAPHFPREEQTVMISDRQKNTLGGRIVLHPLQKEGPMSQAAPEEGDPAKRHTVTLHLDFSGKPAKANIQDLGFELNKFFERRRLGLNRIRWGGMQCRQATVARAARRWLAMVEQPRKKRERSVSIGNISEGRLSPNPPYTPVSIARYSDRSPSYSNSPSSQVQEIFIINSTAESSESLKRKMESDEGEFDQAQGRRKRPKLSLEPCKGFST